MNNKERLDTIEEYLMDFKDAKKKGLKPPKPPEKMKTKWDYDYDKNFIFARIRG